MNLQVNCSNAQNKADKKVTRKSELSSWDKIRGAEFVENLNGAGFTSDSVAEHMKNYADKNNLKLAYHEDFLIDRNNIVII